MIPPPMPTSPDRNRTSSAPTAAPRRASASAPRSASLATWIGTLAPNACGDRVAKTDVDPAEVRRHRDDAVRLRGRRRRPRRRSRSRCRSGRSVGRSVAANPARTPTTWSTEADSARPIDPCLVEDVATETDDRRCQRVDFDIEGKHRRGRGDGRHERRRASWRSSAGRAALGDEAARDKLTDEAADRAARQACPGHELRAGEGAASMELTDDQAQVRAANRLAAMPEVVLLNRHRICVPLFQMVVRDCCRGSTRCQDGCEDGNDRDPLGNPVDGEHRPKEGHPGNPWRRLAARSSRSRRASQAGRRRSRRSSTSRGPTARTRRSSPTPRSTPSTSRSRTTSMPSGRSPRPVPASTSCARSRWR